MSTADGMVKPWAVVPVQPPHRHYVSVRSLFRFLQALGIDAFIDPVIRKFIFLGSILRPIPEVDDPSTWRQIGATVQIIACQIGEEHVLICGVGTN